MGEKRLLYAGLGVKESFVFDPEDRYLTPALQGFRTRKGQSLPLKPTADGSLRSRELGLRLVPEGAMLRLVDAETGQRVLTRNERANELQTEVDRLRALLRKKGHKP